MRYLLTRPTIPGCSVDVEDGTWHRYPEITIKYWTPLSLSLYCTLKTCRIRIMYRHRHRNKAYCERCNFILHVKHYFLALHFSTCSFSRLRTWLNRRITQTISVGGTTLTPLSRRFRYNTVYRWLERLLLIWHITYNWVTRFTIMTACGSRLCRRPFYSRVQYSHSPVLVRQSIDWLYCRSAAFSVRRHMNDERTSNISQDWVHRLNVTCGVGLYTVRALRTYLSK